jgi:DNA-binding response OmpR family regulator
MIKIMVVDDEPGIRRLIKDFLVRQDIEVIEAEDGLDAMLKFTENQKDLNLIILDVMMPRLDGFGTLKEIRKMSDIPVIMLTAKSEDEAQINSFENGANDYVTKPFSIMILMSRIKNQLRDLYSSEISLGDLTINIPKRKAYLKGEEMQLTLKEYALLLYLLKSKGIAISREDLLKNVWNEKDDSRTVDTHIKQLRAKLADSDIVIETVRGFGYALYKSD